MVKVAIVCTSAAYYRDHPTGLWLEEAAGPYYLFASAGFDVVLTSPAGGPIPIDAGSLADGLFTKAAQTFMHDATAVGALHHSSKVEDLDWNSEGGLDAIFLAGGHGTCSDFIDNAALKKAIETMHASGKVVGAVCHGPMALCDCMQLSTGLPLVAGKKVAGFSNSEEQVTPFATSVPFLLESKLVELGGLYEKGDDWTSKVCVDATLVTGQNPSSSEGVAEAMIELLNAKSE